MRERHQRPRVQDCGARWRICYWDYRSTKRSGRTKCWAKSLVPTRTEAQRLADGFMETVNQRNNEPQLFPGGEETLAGLVAICREKMWPLLKNSTRISYDYHLDTYILPKWGSRKLTKLRTIELQDFFNSFSPRLASKTIRNMHGCLRALLNQGKAWELVRAESRTRRPVATQEGTEASRCARKARHSPCDRGVAGTHKISRDLDGRGFVAGRGDCGFALGENPSGSNRNRGAFLRRRIRRYQNRCWSQEHSARFARNLAGGSGCGVAAVKTSKSGRPGFHERKRRSGEPAESVAAATQADDQEAWIARFDRFPELSHHALQPDEQHWRPA